MFRTITSPSSGASAHKLYDALVCSCYQASVAVAWLYIHATGDSPKHIDPNNGKYRSFIRSVAFSCFIYT